MGHSTTAGGLQCHLPSPLPLPPFILLETFSTLGGKHGRSQRNPCLQTKTQV